MSNGPEFSEGHSLQATNPKQGRSNWKSRHPPDAKSNRHAGACPTELWDAVIDYQNVLPISPNTCYLCPRSVHGSLPHGTSWMTAYTIIRYELVARRDTNLTSFVP